ncbi:hypothetical protein ABIB62_002624 [Mucilaginibacter sp. UYP25]
MCREDVQMCKYADAKIEMRQSQNHIMMKVTSLLLLAALGLSSCKWGNEKKVQTDGIFRDTVAYTYQAIHERAADCGSKPDSTCTVVDIKYPVFKGKPVLNDTVKHKLLNMFMLGEKADTSLNTMTAAFIKSYEDFKNDDPQSKMYYTLNSYAKVIGQDSALITLEYGGYAFQGGAHGGSFTGFITWDGKLNKNVTLDDILIAGYKPELTKVAERIFRKDEKLTPTKPLDDYFFDKNKFALNQNYSITPLGLRFMYNQYEIKPYAAGQTELIIPYSEISKLMRPKSVASQYLHKNAGI